MGAEYGIIPAMKIQKHIFALLLASALLIPSILEGAVECTANHPAALAARDMIAKSPLCARLDIRLEVSPSLPGVKHDGYIAEKHGSQVTIRGMRPRSLLFAAGEIQRWAGMQDGKLVRDPKFARRMLNYTGNRHTMAEWVAATGANIVQLRRNAPARMAKECADADVACYAFLYGCDPMKWNRAKCTAYLEEHPSCKATDPGRSWEKGIMCPSDPATWAFFAQTIVSIASQADYEGVAVTFWDDYGLNCHCKRCRESGMDRFSNQVAAAVKCFEEALKPLGKKLLVRTWSSGCPHFLVDEWVHAPGYGGTGGEPMELWGKTYSTADKSSTIIQTKVYNCDCQPLPPFSRLLGEAAKAGFTEFAEWQITGQTLGLQWLPACVVEDTASRMKRAFSLVGAEAGVCLYAGGYNNRDYEALDDIMNSVNIYAWRQLSWNPEDDLETIWREWAAPIYGKGAPWMVKALKETQMATAVSFSPLGLGAPTESRFTTNINRREDLLRYTNRTFLPEGRAVLEPTKENIAKVVEEKDSALAAVKRMEGFIAQAARSARQDARPVWLEEVSTRTAWLKTHLLCTKAIDGALWRYRYLKHLSLMAQTDKEAYDGIVADFEAIRANHKHLFAHAPSLKLSFYPDECADREISLRSPVPILMDIRSNAVYCVEKVLGPVDR